MRAWVCCCALSSGYFGAKRETIVKIWRYRFLLDMLNTVLHTAVFFRLLAQ